MSQSRRASIVETTANIAVGFAINFLAQPVIYPLFHIKASSRDNFEIALIFMALSLGRAYGLRRLFNLFHRRQWSALT